MENDVTNLPDANETKLKIFMVAARLIAEKGYNGVSMREISEHSAVSKPTIYYYFGSKEGIYKALLRAGLEHSSQLLNEVKSQKISVKQKLIILIQNYFKQCQLHPEFMKFYFSLSNRLEELPFLEEFQKIADENRETVIQVIQEGIDSGEFGRSATAEFAAEIIAGVLGHFLWKQSSFSENILSDKLAEDTIEFLFKGLNE
jgi:AcrR family transcriptional regulator